MGWGRARPDTGCVELFPVVAAPVYSSEGPIPKQTTRKTRCVPSSELNTANWDLSRESDGQGDGQCGLTDRQTDIYNMDR